MGLVPVRGWESGGHEGRPYSKLQGLLGAGERPHTDLSRKARLGGSVGSAGQLHSARVMADSKTIAKQLPGVPDSLP